MEMTDNKLLEKRKNIFFSSLLILLTLKNVSSLFYEIKSISEPANACTKEHQKATTISKIQCILKCERKLLFALWIENACYCINKDCQLVEKENGLMKLLSPVMVCIFA